jgi:hypothetical protein
MIAPDLPITASRKRGPKSSKCKNCNGCRLKKACENKKKTPPQSKIQRTSSGGSLRSMESIQAAPALPTPTYSSKHVRDQRASMAHARPEAHNERAGSIQIYNREANKKYHAKIERQRLLLQERQRLEEEKEAQQQQRLNTLRSRGQEDSEDDDEDSDIDMDIGPFQKETPKKATTQQFNETTRAMQ